jgi:hypothetical protein
MKGAAAPVLLFGAPAAAGEANGGLSGRVADEEGRPVVRAEVVALSLFDASPVGPDRPERCCRSPHARAVLDAPTR